MKKIFSKELIVLWLSLAALICAALSLNSSLNLLAKTKQEWDVEVGNDGKKEPAQGSDRIMDFSDCTGMRSAKCACFAKSAWKKGFLIKFRWGKTASDMYSRPVGRREFRRGPALYTQSSFVPTDCECYTKKRRESCHYPQFTFPREHVNITIESPM